MRELREVELACYASVAHRYLVLPLVAEGAKNCLTDANSLRLGSQDTDTIFSSQFTRRSQCGMNGFKW